MHPSAPGWSDLTLSPRDPDRFGPGALHWAGAEVAVFVAALIDRFDGHVHLVCGVLLGCLLTAGSENKPPGQS